MPNRLLLRVLLLLAVMLGLSNVNYPFMGSIPDLASHPTVPTSVMNYNQTLPLSLVGPSYGEEDCYPHPFDVMAIFAVYQNVPSP